MDDSELLARTRDGDSKSVEMLYDRHAPRLYAVARRILGDDDAAAELLEAFFTDIGNCAPIPASAAGLVRAMRDRALARVNRTSQSQNRSGTVHPDEQSETRSDGPFLTRWLLEAAFYGGKSVPELAVLTGRSEPEVRSILCSGMAELRRQFAVDSKQ